MVGAHGTTDGLFILRLPDVGLLAHAHRFFFRIQQAITTPESPLNMSGRLKILGKKSYCPWKADNVARARLAEQQERERQRQETDTEARAIRELRWEKLGRQQSKADNLVPVTAASSGPQRHVNLFEKEENDAFIGSKNVKTHHEQSTTPKNNRLGALVPEGADVPFYLKPPPVKKDEYQNREEEELNERKRRERMDPMSQHHKERDQRKHSKVDMVSRGSRLPSSDSDSSSDEESKRKRRKRRKKEKKKRRREKDSDVSDAGPSIQELRKRRIERERVEIERQKNLQKI